MSIRAYYITSSLKREDSSILARAESVYYCLADEKSASNANDNSNHGSTDVDPTALGGDTTYSRQARLYTTSQNHEAIALSRDLTSPSFENIAPTALQSSYATLAPIFLAIAGLLRNVM